MRFTMTRSLVRTDSFTVQSMLTFILTVSTSSRAMVFNVTSPTWDDAKLSADLAKLVDDPDLQAATGFDQAAVDLLLSRVAQDSGSTEVQSAEQIWQGMPTFDTQDKTAFRQFTVHCPDHAAVELLAERLGIKITERTRAFWFPPVEIETYADKRYTT